MFALREAAKRGQALDALVPTGHPGWKAAAAVVHSEVADRVAQQHQISADVWSNQVEICLAAQLADAEIRVRMRPNGFAGFVREGRYITQFERPGVGGGAKHRAIRTLVEHTVMGVPPDCAPADRPVYGYLSGSNEASPALQQYGPVVLHLKPSVERRATFTGADSLDFVVHAAFSEPSIVPAPLSRPTRTALPAHDVFVAVHGPSPTLGRIDVDPLARQGFGDLTSYGYAEAQIFGGLTLADVRAFTVTLNAAIDAQVLKRLGEAGVSCIMTSGDQP